MAILIKKLDGTVEFTVSAEDFTCGGASAPSRYKQKNFHHCRRKPAE